MFFEGQFLAEDAHCLYSPKETQGWHDFGDYDDGVVRSHVPLPVAQRLREHKLNEAATSTFAAVRAKLEAKLAQHQHQNQQRPKSSRSEFLTPVPPAPLPPLVLSLSLPSHRCFNSPRNTNCTASSSNSSRMPMLLDIARDFSRLAQHNGPFTPHVSSCSTCF